MLKYCENFCRIHAECWHLLCTVRIVQYMGRRTKSPANVWESHIAWRMVIPFLNRFDKGDGAQSWYKCRRKINHQPVPHYSGRWLLKCCMFSYVHVCGHWHVLFLLTVSDVMWILCPGSSCEVFSCNSHSVIKWPSSTVSAVIYAVFHVLLLAHYYLC